MHANYCPARPAISPAESSCVVTGGSTEIFRRVALHAAVSARTTSALGIFTDNSCFRHLPIIKKS
jgi:hypothetical protein